MASILPFACVPHPVWSPLADEIHAAIWDRVGLGKVQGFVREWASDWGARFNDAKAAEAIWDPELPDLPLPPSHRSRSLAEKWAALSAVHDVFELSGDKVLPWPLPEDKQDLVAFTEWLRVEGGAYLALMRVASTLAETAANPASKWLKAVKAGWPAAEVPTGTTEPTVKTHEKPGPEFSNRRDAKASYFKVWAYVSKPGNASATNVQVKAAIGVNNSMIGRIRKKTRPPTEEERKANKER